jgi:hypothetical protein
LEERVPVGTENFKSGTREFAFPLRMPSVFRSDLPSLSLSNALLLRGDQEHSSAPAGKLAKAAVRIRLAPESATASFPRFSGAAFFRLTADEQDVRKTNPATANQLTSLPYLLIAALHNNTDSFT